MEAKAIGRYLKFSPQKARLVVDLIRGKKVEEAITTLQFCKKAATPEIAKVLKSAVANAENTKKLNPDRLIVKRAFVDGGPVLKRMHSKAMGRGGVIRRRTSHVTIIVGEV